MPQHEGPCLLVEWFDADDPVSRWMWYLPGRRCSLVSAEDFMLGWMRSRRSTIRSMTWHWGEWPAAVPKGRMLPYGQLPRCHP